MLKGFAITPPVIGRISIGRVVLKDGKRLPKKDDGFTVTTQVQTQDGWMLHPLDELLRKGLEKTPCIKSQDAKPAASFVAESSSQELANISQPSNASGVASKVSNKLRTIPIKLLFDDPNLSMRASYSFFDRQTGRPICVGNGETCRRVVKGGAGMESLTCPGPSACPLGAGGACKPYGRLNVRIDADGAEVDETGSFIFRTTGYNSIRALAARLRYFAAVTGGCLSTLPLELRLRGKSTTMSHRSPVYYVDIVLRTGLQIEEAVKTARALHAQREASGFDQAALDVAAKLGFANGEFEDTEEEGVSVVEEFYPEEPSTATEHGRNTRDESSVQHDSGNLPPQSEIQNPFAGAPRQATKPAKTHPALSHKLAERLEASKQAIPSSKGKEDLCL